jgi:hypothetical protein
MQMVLVMLHTISQDINQLTRPSPLTRPVDNTRTCSTLRKRDG